MNFKNLAFRTQIFLGFLLLIFLPVILIGGISIKQNISYNINNYTDSMDTIISQANLTLDTLLADATKVAEIPLLNTEVSNIMKKNYLDNDYEYAKDDFIIKNHLKYANRLNIDLISCVYKNKYNYYFDYNIVGVNQYEKIKENIEEWIPLAEASEKNKYFGPIQESYINTNKRILPMIKLIQDSYNFEKIGVCYIEINFKSIEKILLSAQSNKNTLLIYNSEGIILYNSAELDNITYNTEEFKNEVSSFNKTLSKTDPVKNNTFKIGKNKFYVNGHYNKTTDWNLVQVSGENTISQLYKNTYITFINIFIIFILFGIVLAVFISKKLTDAITTLSNKIDNFDTINDNPAELLQYISNKELKTLVHKFNNLNQTLIESVEHNYEIRLDEQQTRIQMLQFQINHHFLYNTLNVIKSLANIHNIIEIETIVSCMSDLIRYNLEKFPRATLEEEILQIHRYMTIQSIRFPNRFIFECNIPKHFYDVQIPAFIFQPFIENSIEHGFKGKNENCYISITINSENNNLHFFIADSGQGISCDKLIEVQKMLSYNITHKPSNNLESSKIGSIGIINVDQRIKNLYGNGYGVTIESAENQGTIIDIVIPLNYK